jgi:hypothetical protein
MAEKRPKKRCATFTLLRGVCGLALYLNDRRIAGEKPWGGGKVVQEWVTDPERVATALRGEEANDG